ncbi:putative FAD-binding dehydrogenase [Crateriforma conspicua]|uniref:Putative FAD-binding dehydrogenase n=1 Tax=Crateriforma conspicua TaxID=2527996 RepID=A0A5C6FPW9_9PLAN|nr:NAD(P)/FAD-dependent oxidoreductase [Crateriforma conspicua]TWU63302.1 putative FAD-binding dehydrogenase [Crateriforma conspicua]
MAADSDSEAEIIVIGAGAAGLIASAVAAQRSRGSVCLLEKNRKTGVKILMSGGTRCNLTHDTDARGITTAFGHARRFLQPSVGSFDPSAVVAMFNDLGVRTKRESTGKIFPVNDRAVEVRDALHRQAENAGVQIRRPCAVIDVQPEAGDWVVDTDQGRLRCKRLIVTAGGRSYPGCGTTGDAYAWLQRLGHTIMPTHPALVPLVGGPSWMHDLSGVTVDDVAVSVRQMCGQRRVKKPLLVRRASWLFTHFGYSGPGAMDVSRYLTGPTDDDERRFLTIDLTPEVSGTQWEEILRGGDGQSGRTRVGSLLGRHLPSRLADALTRHSDADHTLASLPAAGRRRLVDRLKRLNVPVADSRGFTKAEVTAGGVDLSQVDPRSMASRIHNGLYIAGEVLDVDGWIGGYNFQAAFSTGRAAGIAAARSLETASDT